MDNLLDSSNRLIEEGVALGGRQILIEKEGQLEAERKRSEEYMKLYTLQCDENRELKKRLEGDRKKLVYTGFSSFILGALSTALLR